MIGKLEVTDRDLKPIFNIFKATICDLEGLKMGKLPRLAFAIKFANLGRFVLYYFTEVYK
jgi:hypothetical protein